MKKPKSKTQAHNHLEGRVIRAISLVLVSLSGMALVLRELHNVIAEYLKIAPP